MLTLTFVVGDRIITTHCPEEKVVSEYINTLFQDFGNIDILVPDKYQKVFNNYLSYLKDRPNKNFDVNHLYLYFNMYTYFIDQGYLKYCMQQIYDIWFCFYPVFNTFPSELQREIYSYIPCEFVPPHIRNQPLFFDSWLEINQDKQLFLNMLSRDQEHPDIFHTEVHHNKDGKQKRMIRIYHTRGNKRVGCERIILFSYGKDTTTPISHEVMYNMGYQLHRKFYGRDQVKRETHYLNSKKSGLEITWYKNGDIESVTTWLNGKKHGLCQFFLCGMSLGNESYYVEGREEGIWRRYFDNKLMKEFTTSNGKLNGPYTSWYTNGQMESQGHYSNGYMHGKWQKWQQNGEIKSETFH